MQRPNAAQLAYGSATVVVATVALLLLSGTTSTLGITAVSLAGLLLGLLVAVTMPVRTTAVKAPDEVPAQVPVHVQAQAAASPENEKIRVPAPRVGAGADARISS
ncbi:MULTISPECIES: hypothetical protein [Streptomyces]|uniref:Uncharacterized protein n=1 Tax=Streptomyces venezuelae (strain ATCC 10712 / CBS 650.69 / DSM 40230 / JCM 4526 / NBRC 13096 / PD 04745) TaxID=953739 RepID=F2R4U2_STRVP|nr:hypothetical protein [Streptomyces venezuelae]APE21866.1 hypothetical protein vnz_13125 [Streptomyces venezuelae]QER99260.1 hypothetical protein DEJ43_13290 [Streptomyces venezuelae ATCC 10712]CCA55963.1 hypothetical protein SVEN_2677 [Streptomyces venezuelae ATCC 10712]